MKATVGYTIIVLITSVLAAGSALSQQSANEELLKASITTIDGAQDPAGIPRSVALEVLARAYQEIELNDSDAEILRSWANTPDKLRQDQEQAGEERYRDMCAAVIAGDITAREALADAEAIDELREEGIVQSFNEARQKLSERGRVAVEAFIDSRLVPGIKHRVIDYENIVAVNNQMATQAIAHNCAVKLTMSQEEIRQMLEAAGVAVRGDASGAGNREGTTQQQSGASGEIDSP